MPPPREAQEDKMDRRDVARQFKARLTQAMQNADVSRLQLAREVGIDRSTLSQLLSDETDRLPRADTVAAIASVLQVSLDWLLGLSQENRLGADILHESLEITPSTRAPLDESLERWHAEATGYKIRYVPTTLPDLIKTDAVIRHEFKEFAAKTPGQARAAAEERLAYSRIPETDIEICMPIHELQMFARGEGTWRGLDAANRREQIERFAHVTRELYPSLRLYLYDALSHYSVPFTVFGPQRAAIYVGQMYFVFNTVEHIRMLTQHFDSLIRAAVVQSADATPFIESLLEDVA
jgi:transcriptional regulator with XRE-family HTH domain